MFETVLGGGFRVSHPVVNDDDYGKPEAAQPRRDPAVFEGQRRHRLRSQRPLWSLPVDRRDSPALPILTAVQGSARRGARIPGEDDWFEPAAGDALDRSISANRPSPREGISAASLRTPVPPRRYRPVGRRGPSPWADERTGDPENSTA